MAAVTVRALLIDEKAVVQMARSNITVLRLCRVFAASKQQIEDILTRHGITPVAQAYRKQPPQPRPPADPDRLSLTAEDQFWRAPRAKPNPMGEARRVWQERLTDTGGCLKLDGRPILFNDLIRKTNAVRVQWGLPQLDANPAWLNKSVD